VQTKRAQRDEFDALRVEQGAAEADGEAMGAQIATQTSKVEQPRPSR